MNENIHFRFPIFSFFILFHLNVNTYAFAIKIKESSQLLFFKSVFILSEKSGLNDNNNWYKLFHFKSVKFNLNWIYSMNREKTTFLALRRIAWKLELSLRSSPHAKLFESLNSNILFQPKCNEYNRLSQRIDRIRNEHSHSVEEWPS